MSAVTFSYFVRHVSVFPSSGAFVDYWTITGLFYRDDCMSVCIYYFPCLPQTFDTDGRGDLPPYVPHVLNVSLQCLGNL